MTAISLACKSKDAYIKSFLRVMFEQDQHSNEKIALTNDVMERCLSIVKPYLDRDISQLRCIVEDHSQKKQVKKATKELAKRRFNEKAYELIKVAGDSKILHETHPLFTSWY